MDFKRLERRIMQDEGFRARPYLDTRSIPTIGYGTTKMLGRSVEMDDTVLSAEGARQLLRGDLYGAIIDACDLFPRLPEMNDCRQEVLVNMAYNMGRPRLAQFINTRAAASRLDYDGIADGMADSEWHRERQVGDRSAMLIQAMRTGAWPY